MKILNTTPQVKIFIFRSKSFLLLAIMLYSLNLFAEHNIHSNSTKYKTGNNGFVKNAGQVYDYDKNLVPQVLYSLNSDNSSIFLTSSGLTYSIIEREFQSANPTDNLNGSTPEKRCIDKKVARVDMDLTGASILKENIVEQEFINDVPLCFYGATLTADAQNLRFCKQVLIKNVYPNIDWVLKITPESTFKYDFIVHAGGNINSIKLQYNGANTTLLNPNKDELTLSTSLGNITEGKLYCYTQEDQFPVKASYNIYEDFVSLKIAEYNKNKTLVIDPAIEMALTWSTYYGGGAIGGGGGTICNSIKADENNNRVYVAGYCFSNPFPNYNNGVAYYFSPVQAGSTIEAFISAFDLGGVQKWASYYMSTDYDAAFDVTTDNNGNVYMVGTTESHNSSTIKLYTQAFPGIANSYLQSANHAMPLYAGVLNYQEGFIVRFNVAGKLKWATLLGGEQTDQLYSVACDNHNNVFVAGLTWSTCLLPTLKLGSSGYLQSSLNGGQDGLLAGFNSNTKLIWCTYYGTSGTDCRTVKCDASNNIYLTGSIGCTTGFPFCVMPSAYNNSSSGYYVSSFYPSGKRKWSSSFQPGQYITDLNIDQTDGSLLIAGYTVDWATFPWQNDLNATVNTFFDSTYNGGDYDGFIMLLNPDYSMRWSTIIGGNGNDQVTSTAITNTGKIFLSGYTDNSSTNVLGTLPVMDPGTPAYFEGNMTAYTPGEIFISAFESKSGSDPMKLAWSTLFGDDNSGREIAYDIDVCGRNLFLCGSAFLEPANPAFPLIHEPNGFLQCASNPMVPGFNPSGSNGLILKFVNAENSPLRTMNAQASTLKIYPNPCADKFIYLQPGDKSLANAKFEIVDVFGRTIKKVTTPAPDGEVVKIDLDGIGNGYYLLSICGYDIFKQIPFIRF